MGMEPKPTGRRWQVGLLLRIDSAYRPDAFKSCNTAVLSQSMNVIGGSVIGG